jgi:predicted peroxiredoxin
MAKILSIAERAYHGTIEEQDDTIMWMTHILKKGGADISLLLRGNAVNYSVVGQDASGLSFGGEKMEVGPKLDRDLAEIISAGVPTYVVKEDLEDRGISLQEINKSVKVMARKEVADLFDSHDAIWHW